MKKKELKLKTDAVANETKTALQTMFDALNKGQQNKILKNKEVAELLKRYGIEETV